MKKILFLVLLGIAFNSCGGDFYLSNLSVSPNSLYYNSSTIITASVIIQYSGKDRPPSTISVNYYLSTDQYIDGSDINLSGMGYTGTNYPKSTTYSFSIPANTPIGNYYLICYVDPFHNVAETNENNNTVAIAFTIKPNYDLKFTSVNISSDISNDCSFTISGYIKNDNTTGGGATPVTCLSVYESSSPSGGNPITSSIQIPAIAEGATQYFSQNVTLPDLGGPFPMNHYIILKTDGTNLIEEPNESNNYYSQNVTVSLPDLTVSNVSCQSSVNNTGQILVSFDVINNSDYSTCATTLAKVTYSNVSNSIDLNVGQTIPAIGANSTYSVSNLALNVLVPSGSFPQNGLINVIIDQANKLAETNDNNNIGSTTITVTDNTYPDLLIKRATSHKVENGNYIYDYAIYPDMSSDLYYGVYSASYVSASVTVMNASSVDLYGVEITTVYTYGNGTPTTITPLDLQTELYLNKIRLRKERR